jgi:hypothetical protein
MLDLRDDRAISEVLGYVVVFSIVVSAVLLVTGGFGVIENVRDTERERNAGRAFDVAAENMAALYERNAPSRTTEIDLGTAEIFYARNTSITVSGDGSELASYDVRPVEMRVTDDTSYVYAAGAVFRDGAGGDLITRDPPLLLSKERVHLPIVQTTAPAVRSIGSGTVLLRGEQVRQQVLVADESYTQLTVEIASPRFQVWSAYLSDTPGVSCTTDAAIETVSCTVDNPESVYVTHHQISLSLIE